MNENDASRIIIDNSRMIRMIIQIVVSLFDNSSGIIYYGNMLVQATESSDLFRKC